MAAVFVGSGSGAPLAVHATTIEEIKGQIGIHTSQLEQITNQLVDLETEQDILQEQMDDLNAEILNTMASIGVKEDEIAAKEEEILSKEEAIVQKEIQIKETEAEYEAAVAREEAQRESMAMCVRIMYERGTDSYLTALLSGKGLAGILNQMDHMEKVYEYENSLLLEYIDTKNQVNALWDRLEEEKEDLEADKLLLEADREQLKADREEMQAQKAELDVMMAKLERESADYAAAIAKARAEAAKAKKLLQEDQQRLKQLQAAQNASNAANATYAATSYTTTIDNATGSELGKQVAKFACQYIGNPYVYGGTSLTSGADCSGFTYRVYSEFGYQLPRTSTQQRSVGVGVSYSEAQPGDIICYEGHVAIYIGGGLIVHASNSKPYPSGGIKVSQAQYRTILSVRRIVK